MIRALALGALAVAAPASPAVALTAFPHALVAGPTSLSTPGSSYTSEALNYLHAAGYDGTDADPLTLNNGSDGAAYLGDDQDIVERLVSLQPQFDDGTYSAADPLWLFGYSQSSTALTAVDSHLHDVAWLQSVDPGLTDAQAQALGTDAPDLHLVLIGDPAAPGGFDNNPSTEWILQLFGFGATDDGAPATEISGQLTNGTEMIGQQTNLDLSPTTVYTVAGDNWAQPSWAGDLSSWQHLAYLGFDQQQIVADFTPDTALDTGSIDYFQAPDSVFNLWEVLADALQAW